MNNFRNTVLIICLGFVPSAVFSQDREQQRADFVLAEKLIAQGQDDAFFELGARLVEYPLYPYLQYQWLLHHLEHSEKIQSFLENHKETRYAGLLRSKWLSYLADHQRWREFVQHYQANGSTSLECRFHWANYIMGHTYQALVEARRLWSVGASQPPECEPLFTALTQSPLLTSDLIWERFERALKEDNVLLASYLRNLFNKGDQSLADVWLKVHRTPVLIRDSGFLTVQDGRWGRLFAHGVDRIAKSDLDLAIMIWDANKRSAALDSRTVERVERRLALSLAHHQKPGAYARLNQLLSHDNEVREWKVRAALYEQDWQRIADAVSGLTLEEQMEPRGQYWRARALAVKGDAENARMAYVKLAEDRSFYGFLAADAIAKPYRLSDKPVQLGGNELELLAAENDFQAVRELKVLNREMEAERQWWHAVKKLSKERLAIAAKLAQFWQWDQLAIKTLVKADYWDDLVLRFPISYLSQVQANALRQNLDPSMVLGLIRQESMLDSHAQSPVGALGLMQIMPKTGRFIAEKLQEPWQSDNSLLNPDINIRYGSYYYKSLLDTFHGHVVLATAAYNAGPAKVKKWLPMVRPTPADIWVETIPYKETRKYVTSVLSYIIIYQYRIQRNGLKMKDLMRDIVPG